MAVDSKIVVEVEANSTGFEEAIERVEDLSNASRAASTSVGDLTSSMGESSDEVLRNGGAMALLNSITGGYAQVVKDAVEASTLFAKSSKALTAAQTISNFVVGASTGGLKLFRIALASTGVGLLVIALGLLIVNFKDIMKWVEKVIPAFGIIKKIIGGLVDAITDFVGATSDASRELDRLGEQADKMNKRNQEFLDLYGDKYDQYTKRKIQANIDYAENVKKVNEDETKSEKEKLETIQLYRDKANREIARSDDERNEANRKRRQDEFDKEAKEIADNADKKDKAAQARSKAELDRRRKAEDELNKLIDEVENESDVTEQQKLDRKKERELEEINSMKLNQEERIKILAAFNDKYSALQKTLNDRTEAETIKNREAIMDIENMYMNRRLDLEADTAEKKYWRDLENIEMEKANKILEIENMVGDETLKEEAKIELELYYRDLKAERDLEWADEDRAIKKEDADAEIEAQRLKYAALAEINEAGLSSISSLQELFGKKSKGWQAASKALALTQIGIDTASAFSKMMAGVESSASGAAMGAPGPAAPAVYLSTKIAFYASGVATILANAAKAKSILSGSGAGGSTTGGGAPAPSMPPQFNVVGQSGENQLATTIAGKQGQPVEAFVVGQSVTTQQSMDRNIVNNATFM